jgi:hypothetical protein
LFFNRASLQTIFAGLTGIFLSSQIYSLYAGLIHRADFLYWDPSAHAYYGVQLAAALRNLNLLEMLRVTNEQVLWPPLQSYLQIPIQLTAGPSFYASSFTSFIFLPLTLIAISFFYQQLSEDWSGWICVMALAAGSPYYAGYSSMPMLEIFGAAFTAWSAALYLRKSRWFPLSLMLLFFLKYNYFFYLALPVAALEGWKWCDQTGRHTFRFSSLFTPFRIFVAVYIFAMLLILITGGIEIAGVSIRGIGNPAYILLLILVLRFLIKKQYLDVWPRLRISGWSWFVIPVLIWLLIPIPNRVRTIVSFLMSRPLGGHEVSQLSYWTFYFKAFPVYFADQWLLFSTFAAAAIVTILTFKNQRIQFAVLLFVIPFILMTFNQNKQERFLFSFIFALWILAGYAISKIPQIAVRGTLAAIVVAASVFFWNKPAVAELVAWPFIPASMDEPVRYIASELKTADSTLVFGVSNELSPALISYHVQKANSFQGSPRIQWRMKNQPGKGTHLILIRGGTESLPQIPPDLLRNSRRISERSFENGLVIEHRVY